MRTLAKELGVSRPMVHRVWKTNNLRPHLSETFKVSNDPQFVEKVADVVGLYLDPPQHGLVLSVDEKSQIQVLDRTQPSLPMCPGHCGTMTHDYKRHGTTTLFAALEMAEGRLIGQCMPRPSTVCVVSGSWSWRYVVIRLPLVSRCSLSRAASGPHSPHTAPNEPGAPSSSLRTSTPGPHRR